MPGSSYGPSVRHLAWMGIAGLVALTLKGCAKGRVGERPQTTQPATVVAVDEEPREPGLEDLFVEVEQSVGLDFTHINGARGEYFFHEMMGAGLALFDYDLDGDLDVYLVQGHALPKAEQPQPSDRLFENQLVTSGNSPGSLSFVDATKRSSLRAVGYGMGVTSGDFDNDGYPDLYLTNFGANQLWRNRGDGTFEDVTKRARVGDSRWGVSALAFDFDRDGWLDLYVGNYLSYSIAGHQLCRTTLGKPNYCGPLSFRPQSDVLYRNLGNGEFEDVSGRAGIANATGGALGVTFADFDLDGWLDVYVANDGMLNHLWMNQGDGRFLDNALLSGAAANAQGQPEASMGTDVADYDHDGDEDLFMTHLRRETNTLFVNDGAGQFSDASSRSGVGAPSLAATGFGTSFIDIQNNGLLDIVTVNGAVRLRDELLLQGVAEPLAEPNQLLLNSGDGFVEARHEAGAAFTRRDVSRGAAFGDLDNDGDTDIVINNNGGPARVLLNQVGAAASWVGLRLLVGDPGRDALGAWVGVSASGEQAVWRRVSSGGSYASAGDARLLVGLGEKRNVVVTVWVRWPDNETGEAGGWERFEQIPSGSYSTLRRGGGLRGVAEEWR